MLQKKIGMLFRCAIIRYKAHSLFPMLSVFSVSALELGGRELISCFLFVTLSKLCSLLCVGSVITQGWFFSFVSCPVFTV